MANEENTPDLMQLFQSHVAEAMGASDTSDPTLRAPGGGDITIYIADADAPTQAADSAVDAPGDYPVLNFGFLSGSPTRNREEDDYQETDIQESEDFTYDADVDVYEVSEKDITNINSVTGTLNGSSGHTFNEGTDFEVFSPIDYTTDTGIEWLDGGDNPDDGTTFTVDYDHRKVFKVTQMRWDLNFRLTLRVPVLDSGERGASKDYPIPSRLAMPLQDALVSLLGHLQGDNLWPTADQDPNHDNPAPEPGSYVLHDVQAMGRLPVPEDGSVFEATIDVRTRRLGKYPGDEIRVAGKTLVTPDPSIAGTSIEPSSTPSAQDA